MRFTIEQCFDAGPAAVVAAYTDPDLYPTMTGLSKVATPQVISREQVADRVHLRLRMQFIADVSAAARAVIDPKKVTWIQDEHYDLGTLHATVIFRPDEYANRFSCQGGYIFVADPANPASGCVRRVDGDLKIRMPLVGGQVERAMVSGLREHFAEEQPLVDRWLADR